MFPHSSQSQKKRKYQEILSSQDIAERKRTGKGTKPQPDFYKNQVKEKDSGTASPDQSEQERRNFVSFGNRTVLADKTNKDPDRAVSGSQSQVASDRSHALKHKRQEKEQERDNDLVKRRKKILDTNEILMQQKGVDSKEVKDLSHRAHTLDQSPNKDLIAQRVNKRKIGQIEKKLGYDLKSKKL